MRIFINANANQKAEILSKGYYENTGITFDSGLSLIDDDKGFDAFFILDREIKEVNYDIFKGKPVFVNSVVDTLSELGLPPNAGRINGWPGFLERKVWEVVSYDTTAAKKIFDVPGWEIIFVQDRPGFVFARIIAMIINEAYSALKDQVSTREEIDLAMKSGTNYPFGPFEWAEKIGKEKIFDLLIKLSESDISYTPLFEK